MKKLEFKASTYLKLPALLTALAIVANPIDAYAEDQNTTDTVVNQAESETNETIKNIQDRFESRNEILEDIRNGNHDNVGGVQVEGDQDENQQSDTNEGRAEDAPVPNAGQNTAPSESGENAGSQAPGEESNQADGQEPNQPGSGQTPDQPAPEPEPDPDPRPEPKPDPDPEPKPDPEPQPEPDPDPQPEPRPEPGQPADPDDGQGPSQPDQPAQPRPGETDGGSGESQEPTDPGQPARPAPDDSDVQVDMETDLDEEELQMLIDVLLAQGPEEADRLKQDIISRKIASGQATGRRLPDTSTSAWLMGALGLGSLATGLVMKKQKK